MKRMSLVNGQPAGANRSLFIPVVTLTAEEREILEDRVRRRNTAQALAQRARLILACAGGQSNAAIARELRLSRPTIGRWRRRFVKHRIEGLMDAARPGAPPRISETDIKRVIALTLDSAPPGKAVWSTRAVAASAGLSQSAVARIWRTMALQPDHGESFKLSNDPAFSRSVKDLVGLYINPPERVLALAADPETPLQTPDDKSQTPTSRPGQLERWARDFVRRRTTELFESLDAATGELDGRRSARERASDYRRFLERLELHCTGSTVHLVVARRTTHKMPLIQRWLAKHPRYHPHFAPTDSSWPRSVEWWFTFLDAKQLHCGVNRSTRRLLDAIRRHRDTTSERGSFIWTNETGDEPAIREDAGYRISNSPTSRSVEKPLQRAG
jgi:transposase